MDPEALPDWVIPPPDGFTADDFLRMRGLPRHTELIDGSLVFVSPQSLWHFLVIELLVDGLRRSAPEYLRVIREMTVKLGERQVPEPDVTVLTDDAFQRDLLRSTFGAEDVLLAVEVVSPGSVEHDRDVKPRRYAAAGIKHFWRVEREGERAVVYVYELDPASATYALTGIHHDQLKLTVPFDIDIEMDLARVGWRHQ
ncbi:Uma2 family endonuclease [Actinomadura sp. NTSP31]|uniref:Uma2 family endonuclease n=1 Tax=Actinomadura sp. NTSP31 TaxID=1735447 RepID=UPI0035C1BE02